MAEPVSTPTGWGYELSWRPTTCEPLPWGVDELGRFRQLLLSKVDKMYYNGVALNYGGGREISEESWKISGPRHQQMTKDVLSWTPEEPVIDSHKAEAIRIVYEGMAKAGYCPASAVRRPRKRYVG